MITNPISKNTRSWLYIVGIIVGSITPAVVVGFEIYGLTMYTPLVAAIAGSIGAIVGALARSNLADKGELELFDLERYEDDSYPPNFFLSEEDKGNSTPVTKDECNVPWELFIKDSKLVND